MSRETLNEAWLKRMRELNVTGMQGRRYHVTAAEYVRGFFAAFRRKSPGWVPVPTERSVAVVITAKNEEGTIASVVRQAERLIVDEIYVVVNGSTDRTFARARAAAKRAAVLHVPDPLGHDVGRAVGANLSQADIVLFLDGDIPIRAELLLPFIHAVSGGTDMALNNLEPYFGVFSRRDTVTMMKQFLNTAVGRPELAASSLTAVPHALSRHAIETLGPETLSVPPKAQALGILRGLTISPVCSVNVIRTNKKRKQNRGNASPVARLIVGDHVEAIRTACDIVGERTFFDDPLRKRHYAGGEGMCSG